jgi:hypothetical protein
MQEEKFRDNNTAQEDNTSHKDNNANEEDNNTSKEDNSKKQDGDNSIEKDPHFNDKSYLLPRKTLTEVQNVMNPLKRKNNKLELANDIKLKFVKCSNITINIAKE